MWHESHQTPREMKTTEDGGLWDCMRKYFDPDHNKYGKVLQNLILSFINHHTQVCGLIFILSR